MCIRVYRHYTVCGCLLATQTSLHKCSHGPASPLCGPYHKVGIVKRQGEECLYHAHLTKQKRHAPDQSRKPRFRQPSGPGVTDKEIAMAKLDYLRSLDMQERLDHFKAKGIKGSYRGDPKPAPRGGAVVFSRQFDGTEFMGHHPSENTDLTEGDIAQQKARARLRDDFLTTVQKEALFDPSDESLSSAWDDDNMCAETSEADPDAMETTFYSEGAEPMVPSEAIGGASDAMDVDGADQGGGMGQAEDDDNAGGANKEDSSQHEEIWPPTGVEWTAKLKYMTGFRHNHTSTR